MLKENSFLCLPILISNTLKDVMMKSSVSENLAVDTLVLSYTSVITFGPLLHISDYLWFSLIK